MGFVAVKKEWIGKMPSHCDICHRDLSGEKFWIDGATKMGPWGNMCVPCHKECGVGLGTGRGQKYNTLTKVKVEG